MDETDYRREIEKSPKSIDNWRGLVRTLLNQGKYHDAILAFEEIDELSPVDDSYQAKTRIERGFLANEYGEVSRNPTYSPDYKPPVFVASWIHWVDSALLEGKNTDVIEFCKAVVEFDRNHVMGWYWLGVGQFHDGRTEEALESLAKAASLSNTVTFDSFNKMLTVLWTPGNSGRVRGIRPDDPVTKQDLEVEALVERAINLFEKDNNEAEMILREVLRIMANHMTAILYLQSVLGALGRESEKEELKNSVTTETLLDWADYLMKFGKKEQAENALKRALEKDSSNQEVTARLRKMRDEQKVKDVEQEPLKTGFDVITEVRELLKQTKPEKRKRGETPKPPPGEAVDLYEDGQNHSDNERWELAINSFVRALKIYPQYPECWCALGQPVFRLGWEAEAEDANKKAMEINDEIPSVWGDYGSLLLYLERKEEAEEKLLKAVEMDPTLSYAWNNLGTIYSWSDRKEQALNAFRKAVEANPGDLSGWLNLGSHLDQLDRRFEAEEAYQRAIDLNPEVAERVAMSRMAADFNRRNRRRRGG